VANISEREIIAAAIFGSGKEKYMLRLLALLGITATFVNLQAFSGEVSVSVTVSEPAGVARKAGYVRGGIPFKKGQVNDVKELALFSASGQPVPAQFAKLGAYADGSVQWALCDFLVDIPAGKQLKFVVRKGKASPPVPALKISQEGNRITVDTGAAKFVLDKAAFKLLQLVEVGGKKISSGASFELIDSAGKKFLPGKPDKVTWEYRGPLRSTLRLDGSNLAAGDAKCLFYTVRLTFLAGKALLRVQHKIRNSDPKMGFTAKIKEASISLKLAAGAAEKAKGKNWILAQAGGTQVLMVTRHAGGCYPGASSYSGSAAIMKHKLAGDALKTWTVPPAGTAPLSGKRLYGYGDDHFGLADCAHKDTDVWFDFGSITNPEDRARECLSWLHAMPDPVWVSETETLGYGHFGTLADEIACYKKWGWSGWDSKKKPSSKHRPDAYVAKEYVHDVSESDAAECMTLMYMRTGQRGYLDWAQAWAEWYKTHYSYRTDGFEFKGNSSKGTRNPTKGFKFGWHSPKQYYWNDSRAEKCHFYGRGIVDFYCLTGEVDALEGARDLAEQAVCYMGRYAVGKNVGYYGVRGTARMWLGTIRVAQATHQKADLDRAAFIAERVFKASDWDPRGFVNWGAGPAYMAGKNLKASKLPVQVVDYMKKNGITVSKRGIVSDAKGNKWPVASDGGTWQQHSLQKAFERYWRLTGKKEAKVRALKVAEFARDFQFSNISNQSFYYTIVDFPIKGKVFDPAEWDKEKYGINGMHSGSYTRSTVAVFARAYSLSGDRKWLDLAIKAWDHGSKRGYRARKLYAKLGTVYRYAWYKAPKDDGATRSCRMFYEAARIK
jgi:PcRGLX-like protein central beta sandwich domain/PcRGLX-like N-terminal RIFT barrel domain